jgi:signal transduction histidine kinase
MAALDPMTSTPPTPAWRPARGPAASPGMEDAPVVVPWRRRGFWAAFVAYWTVIALLFTGTQIARAALAGKSLAVGVALLVSLSDSLFTALHCLGAFAIAWNLPLEGGRRRTARNLALAAVGAFVVTSALQCVQTAVGSRIAGVPFPPVKLLLLLTVPSQLLLFSCFLASGYAIRYFVRAGENARAASRLAAQSARLEGGLARAELQLAQAQLQVLKMQLDPHFLFNTFNAIAALMHRDPAEADAMLTRLSELLRITLSRSGDQEVTLAEEVEFLRLYLEIQQSRFGERLAVDWRVQPEAEGASVPHLVLQPIVENALQHGIARVPGPGRIGIGARREGDRLVLEVTDTGPGLEGRVPRPGAVGLANTHARLEQMYGDGQTLEMHTREEGGTAVVITLPFRPASSAPREAAACA